ncbi:MAG TPA: S9 family peptidase [Candidatus Dormibacteraeota bacterium]|nr:S9 family peptidase [Candidatus Dormibacteraeota bacterium]
MQPDLIPRSVLFGNPTKVSPAISPDGARLAYIAPVEGILNVWVGSVGSDDFRPVTEDRDRGVRFFSWAHDNRHLLYIQDRGGDENWHLYATDVVAGTTRDLTPFESIQARVVGADKRFPNTLLVGLNRRTPELHDVYRLELESGELTLVAENPGYIGMLADRDLKVRGAFRNTPEGGLVTYIRDDEQSPWREVDAVGLEDALESGPLGFTRDGSLLMRSSRDADTVRLLRLQPDGSREVLFEDEQYDIGGVITNPDTGEPQLVSVLRDRLDVTVLDPALAADVERLRAVHPGDLGLTSRDHADRTWLAAFTSDDGPISYHLYDRTSGQAQFLFTHRPELEGQTLARMEPFSFTARDGLTIHGYLTFPPGLGRSHLPAVLDVHGGPWTRDAWGFNPEAQWFANRGYLCIQVNYRGSTGYGKRFLNAGDREWGAAMHDDLIDAVRWVAEQGLADPARVAIYGGSYGGYAALVGATFTPDVFRCAVDIVGPSNLKTLLETVPPYWAPMIAQLYRRVGNPETDAEFLWSRSPLSRVDQIRIPLLIAQGANDPRVKQAESEQIVAALREKGIPHEYLLYPDEGHGFAKPENRLRFYAAAERFLAQHLGGRCEPAD